MRHDTYRLVVCEPRRAGKAFEAHGAFTAFRGMYSLRGGTIVDAKRVLNFPSSLQLIGFIQSSRKFLAKFWKTRNSTLLFQTTSLSDINYVKRIFK